MWRGCASRDTRVKRDLERDSRVTDLGKGGHLGDTGVHHVDGGGREASVEGGAQSFDELSVGSPSFSMPVVFSRYGRPLVGLFCRPSRSLLVCNRSLIIDTRSLLIDTRSLLIVTMLLLHA